MRANDVLVEACSAGQLELFAEELAESERARPVRVVANDRRRSSSAELEVLPAELPKPRTPPDVTRSAADRAAFTKPSTDRQRTLPRLAVSPDEAAAILGVSRDYLDEHVLGELRVVRRGRRILIALAELERWLDRSATRASLGRS
jgi:excisionase family DNA binding protein